MRPSRGPASTPIALKTCERFTFPDEQAEPDDTAKPSISKAHKQDLRIDGRDGEARRIRQPFRASAENHHARHGARDFRLHLVPPERQRRRLAPLAGALRRRRPRPFRRWPAMFSVPAAQASLLAAAAQERIFYVVRAGAKTKGPGAFRPAKFMRRKDDRIGSQARGITRDFAGRLNRVADR